MGRSSRARRFHLISDFDEADCLDNAAMIMFPEMGLTTLG